MSDLDTFPGRVARTGVMHGRRIQVVGHAGAGKSIFSTKLSGILKVPVIHLDPIFWNDGLIKTPIEQAQNIVRKYAATEDWVIDGNQWVPLKDITYPRATDIIWIDPPFHIWLYRLFSRAIRKAFSQNGSFYKDFVNPNTSIIVQAFRLRDKKTKSWSKALQKDSRWQRVTDSNMFLAAVVENRRRE